MGPDRHARFAFACTCQQKKPHKEVKKRVLIGAASGEKALDLVSTQEALCMIANRKALDIFLLRIVRREVPPVAGKAQHSVKQVYVLVNRAALIARNDLFTDPNVHDRVQDFVQLVATKLLAHVFVVDAPVVMRLFFGRFGVGKIQIIKELV